MRAKQRCTMQPRLATALAASAVLLLALLQTANAESLIGAKLPDDSCLTAARQHLLDSHWLHALRPKSRARPRLDSHHYGVSDWPEGLVPNQAHAGADWRRCSQDVFRYRVVGGVVYADHEHYSRQEIYWDYREVFLEQLLTAMYLYDGDFPDVELFVNMADLPVPCELSLPFMQYNVIDTKSLHAHHMDVQVSHLVWQGNDRTMLQPEQLRANSSINLSGYTRGMTLPYTHAWDRVSLSYHQLRNYTNCLDARHAPGGWSTKKQALIWRGSPTGYQRGWEAGAASGNTADHGGSYVARVLLNKRLYLAAMALRYPWMDVGITGFGAAGPWEAGYGQAAVHDDLVKALDHGFLDAEAWSGYMLQLSVDGHGAPWRLPQQLLGGSAMVIMESPLKGFLAHLLKPSVHYQPVAYDLSDIVSRTKELVHEAHSPDGSKWLERMAGAGREVAMQHLGAMGQLDAFMWSVLKVKELCPWPVEKPGPDWKVVQLRRSRHWISYGTAPVKDAVMQAQAANFV